MTLRVVGAGLGRTGTMSLKLALQKLLDAPCYHMSEVFAAGHTEAWNDALEGSPDWETIFDGYVATVDWPGAAFWREIAAAYPEAVILLSHRDPEAWWRSCDRTIFEMFRHPPRPEIAPWRAMATRMLEERFTPRYQEREPAVAAYEQHVSQVRAEADPARLVHWSPGDGWAPLCSALGVSEPDEPFPHTNTTEEFRSMAGLG